MRNSWWSEQDFREFSVEHSWNCKFFLFQMGVKKQGNSSFKIANLYRVFMNFEHIKWKKWGFLIKVPLFFSVTNSSWSCKSLFWLVWLIKNSLKLDYEHNFLKIECIMELKKQEKETVSNDPQYYVDWIECDFVEIFGILRKFQFQKVWKI